MKVKIERRTRYAIKVAMVNPPTSHQHSLEDLRCDAFDNLEACEKAIEELLSNWPSAYKFPSFTIISSVKLGVTAVMEARQALWMRIADVKSSTPNVQTQYRICVKDSSGVVERYIYN